MGMTGVRILRASLALVPCSNQLLLQGYPSAGADIVVADDFPIIESN